MRSNTKVAVGLHWCLIAWIGLGTTLAAKAYVLEANTKFWPAGNVVMQLQLGTGSGTLIDGSTSWGQVAEGALADWNLYLGKIQFKVVRDSTAAIGNQNNFNNVFFSTTIFGDTWGSSTIGITLNSWTSVRVESDVIFNSNSNRLYNSYRGNLRSAGNGTSLIDLRRLALHEFGHVLGLDHPDLFGQTQPTIMNSFQNNVDDITADDIAGVVAIYGTAVTAPAIATQPQSQTVNSGANVSFTVVTTGTPPFTYQWRKDGTNLAGATSDTLSLTGVVATNAGSYTVFVSNSAGSVTSSAATLTVNTVGRISNMSVRTNLASGQNLVVGFVTSGAKNLLIRAVGPSLKTVFGLTNFYADPKFTINNSTGAIIDQNDSWASTLSSTFTAVGAFGLDSGSKDAALVRSISGANTAQVSGTGAGIMLVEVYDADSSGTTTRLINVSARNQVGTGTDVLVSGFVIVGAPRKVLIRGIGPGLHDVFGVNGFLPDPIVEVHQTVNGVDTVVTSNDNWDSSLTATFDAVGAYHLTPGSKDAALLVTLPAGVYTAQVAGVNSTTGDGVIEVYEVP